MYINQIDFFDTSVVPTANVVFRDRSCGSGKTNDMLRSFTHNVKYFVFVQTRAEIERIITNAIVPFDTPVEGSYVDELGMARCSLLIGLSDLLADGKNVVCTHALFDKVNITEFVLDKYNVIIDEVFDCVKGFSGPKDETFQSTYIEDGLALVNDKGKITPTSKWLLLGDDAYQHKLLGEAQRGRLYRTGEGFYVTVVPSELFTNNASCTVMTYLAQGSLMAMYLDKLEVPYEIDTNNVDCTARDVVKMRLNINYLDLGLTKAQGYARQGNWDAKTKNKITNKLMNARGRYMKGVLPQNIMVTCRKDLWFNKDDEISKFAKDTRLSKANWVHKSTKGTNIYSHCTHAVHMFDINLNPSVKKYLGMTDKQEQMWRQSEIIQWLYRTDLRNQTSTKEVHLYITSEPMKNLIENWLSDDSMQ